MCNSRNEPEIEYKPGTVVEWRGLKVMVVIDDRCAGCVLHKKDGTGCNYDEKETLGRCSAFWRADELNVKFVKVENV